MFLFTSSVNKFNIIKLINISFSTDILCRIYILFPSYMIQSLDIIR